MATLQQQWFGNVRKDILAGMVAGLALIPESLAFAFILGVDPSVALYASFVIAVITAIVGGRTGLISAATGAMALVLVSLMANHGLQYVLAATVLTGIIQVVLGLLGVARLMRFIPNAVVLGFLNALGIMIFMTQLPYLVGVSTASYFFVGGTLLLVYLVPRFFTAIPATLIAIVVMTAIAVFTGTPLQTVGDLGTMPQTLPMFLLPEIPLNLTTLKIILPYSLALAIVGLLETLLTAQVLDEVTETPSDKNKEARGQGIANVVTGFFGGMAGCALIGQSMLNVQSGGRGRLSTLTAGVFLMVLILLFGDSVIHIPMPVLAGIMVMVSFTTFNWGSFRFMRQAPKAEVLVMLTTVAIILYTHNLAIGVVIGILLSALFFVATISRITVKQDGTHYFVEGPLFFASTKAFSQAFDTVRAKAVTIDFSASHLYDESAVAAIQKVQVQLQKKGTTVQLTGLNQPSAALLARLSH